jgi:hypothetical protein
VSLDPLRRWERRLGALPMPSAFMWVALTATFLGFGVLMGRATGTGALAASKAPVKLLVARAPASSMPSAVTPPPPQPEAQPTPEASVEPADPSKGAKHRAGGTSSSPGAPGRSSGTSGGLDDTSSGKESSPRTGKAKLPAIKHVFVVMLSGEPYASAFGPASQASYLTGTLEKQGELLVRYYAVAHEGLADGIALLSGQGPTEATATNCPTYGPVTPANGGTDGQMLGNGCVYPKSTPTLMGQLAAKHLTWKAYVEGIDEGKGGPAACAHPSSGVSDPSASLGSGESPPAYQTWRNPFVYFQAIVESPSCMTHDVGMDGLGGDLAVRARTANFTYIAPGPCDDGSPTQCAPGKASGMVAADRFLRQIVPKILSSKAYKEDGLLAITIDQAPPSGEYADSSSCCGQPRFPNLPAPTGAAALSPPGGGQVGLLLLSPFIEKGGELAQEAYDHFSLLATVEQVFGLAKLGYAGLSEVKPLSASLFSGG